MVVRPGTVRSPRGNSPDHLRYPTRRGRDRGAGCICGIAAGKVAGPSWGAAALWGIAAATGWPECFILWELPLSRLHQYELCMWAGRGIRCWWAEEDSEDVRCQFAEVVRRWADGGTDVDSPMQAIMPNPQFVRRTG